MQTEQMTTIHLHMHSAHTQLTHLTDLEQKRNSECPEDFLVEMCNWNQHFILLVQLNLVERDFLPRKTLNLFQGNSIHK